MAEMEEKMKTGLSDAKIKILKTHKAGFKRPCGRSNFS